MYIENSFLFVRPSVVRAPRLQSMKLVFKYDPA